MFVMYYVIGKTKVEEFRNESITLLYYKRKMLVAAGTHTLEKFTKPVKV